MSRGKGRYVMRDVVGEKTIESTIVKGYHFPVDVLACGHYRRKPVIDSKATAIRLLGQALDKSTPVRRRCFDCVNGRPTGKAHLQ